MAIPVTVKRLPDIVRAVVGAVLGFGAVAAIVIDPLRAGIPIAMAMGILAVAAFVGWVPFRRSGDDISDLLRCAMDADPGGVAIIDGDGVVVYMNPAFEQLLPPSSGGAERRASEISSRLVQAEDNIATFERLGSDAAAGNAACVRIALLRATGGAQQWYQFSIIPLGSRSGLKRSVKRFLGGGGGHIRTLWRVDDITARHEMDSVLRAQSTLYADYIDYLPGGFFTADAEGRIIYLNASLAEWLGVSAAEIYERGMRFSDFVVGPDEAADEASGITGDVIPVGETVLIDSKGHAFRTSIIRIKDFGPEQAGVQAGVRCLVLRDFTRREAMLSAANAAQRLHWLFNEAPVGIVLLDVKGETTDCNRAFYKMLGLHREAIVARPMIDLVGKEDRSDVAAQLSKVVMGTVPAIHLEVRLPVAVRRELVVSLFASRIEDETGEVSGLILHFIDTTEKKHLEAQFAQSQKVHAVGQLAGGVAHDFNNLLTAMIGFCDLLLERHGPGDPSFADIMQVKQNANRATNLVRQLLAFSRKQTLRPETVDTQRALSELMVLLRRLLGEKIDLNLEPDPGVAPIRVDPGQFDQVIINLAVNARDAMPGGGVLTIRTLAETIDIELQRGAEVIPPGDYVLVEVTDTGVGIAKENLERIFEPFFSTKEVGSGTGLGLSTVYGIVRQTGGYIFVDSAPGEGTTFSVYLPSAGGDVSAVTQAGQTSVVGGGDGIPLEGGPASELDLSGTGTVLLVEDEDAVRTFGARALRNRGYRVLEAENGEVALDVINNSDEKIDLVISDVVMPGMDGHTLVRLVRLERPDVRVILISGYAEDAISDDIQRDPDVHFLPKPFSLRDLAGKVKMVMR